MHVIEKILSVEKKITAGKTGYIFTAIVDGNEVTGYSKTEDGFKIGDEVMSFHDEKWDKSKMLKPT